MIFVKPNRLCILSLPRVPHNPAFGSEDGAAFNLLLGAALSLFAHHQTLNPLFHSFPLRYFLWKIFLVDAGNDDIIRVHHLGQVDLGNL